MKKIVSLLFVFAVVLTACTGDQGPMGPPGLPGSDGNDGGIIASSAFEIEVNFNASNEFSHTENFGFEVLDTYVTLVYMSWETIEGKDVWRLLPQNVYFDDGILIYNFDFTQTDVRFFLDGTKKLTTLGSEWTQNQVFRVVVIPADNVGVDVSNLKDVMQAYNIDSFEMK